MPTSAERIAIIQNFLNQIGSLRILGLRGQLPEKLFELECFLRTASNLISRNKIPIAENLYSGVFRPLYNPGDPSNYSYLRFIDRSNEGDEMFLYMNGQIIGLSGAFHAPDITLSEGFGDFPFSIYECKNYSSTLGVGVYREFIGYLTELGLRPRGSRSKGFIRSFPDLSPRIYTSAVSRLDHQKICARYGFTVIDKL